jgi:hypothetical protein
MLADLEAIERCFGNGMLILQSCAHHPVQRGDRRGDRNRIGPVGDGEQSRMIAAAQRPFEAGRDLDYKQNLARRQ